MVQTRVKMSLFKRVHIYWERYHPPHLHDIFFQGTRRSALSGRECSIINVSYPVLIVIENLWGFNATRPSYYNPCIRSHISNFQSICRNIMNCCLPVTGNKWISHTWQRFKISLQLCSGKFETVMRLPVNFNGGGRGVCYQAKRSASLQNQIVRKTIIWIALSICPCGGKYDGHLLDKVWWKLIWEVFWNDAILKSSRFCNVTFFFLVAH